MADKEDEHTPGLLGQLKEAFVGRKMARAERGHLLTGEADEAHKKRLPPGQRLVENWPVLDLGIQPTVTADQWTLDINGHVANPVKWDYATLQAQPRHDQVCDIHCVTAWSRYDNHFEGVSTAHILDLVKPTPSVTHVIFHAYDGYTTNVTLDAFAAPDAMIAHSWNGSPLTREHGGPVRMVLPQWYFWKSAKWIKRIEFVDADQPGFWEVRGYHNEGDPWLEERYS